jgi:sugar phosphate isomerase/epimerase
MPAFSLVDDVEGQKRLSDHCQTREVAIDLVYPFTLAGSTQPEAFAPSLKAAAAIGAKAINVLVYDRDLDRRVANTSRLCDLAADQGLNVAVEFFPASQVGSLREALALVAACQRPALGINVDLLHLVRSGEGVAALDRAACERVIYAQICDGPAELDADQRAHEAAFERQPPGRGQFDVAGFLSRLPAATPISVEAPQARNLAARVPKRVRAQIALDAARRALSYDVV